MEILLFLGVCLLTILVLVISTISLITIYFMLNSKFMTCSPPVPSCGKVKAAMIEDVAKLISKRKSQVVMDLGSGWGSLLLPLAKRFPNHRFVGIEYGCIPYWISRFRARKMKNIVFLRQNFFDADISKANVIFLFLLNSTMAKLATKCLTQTQKGTLIYANRFQLPKAKAKRKVSLGSDYESYYVYQI